MVVWWPVVVAASSFKKGGTRWKSRYVSHNK